ncbi:unnamed protein product [Linum tenue]|uniref:Palmitoyl-protein thioesterase 1 n=1 Tax=Linum tenue TaxID=586396 RepID=A0AAV0JWS2_9ROSI|nr:unnamed protein product [Linum tenue]
MGPFSATPSSVGLLFIITISAATLLSLLPLASSIPFIVLHGIGDECKSGKVSHFTQMVANLSGSPGFCLEVGNGYWDSWFVPMKKQAEMVCNNVKTIDELSNGYNIVGLSQGNLVSRAVIEFCEDGPPDHLAPSGYLKLPDDMSAYLSKSKFLPQLNNEHPEARNPTFKQRFRSLKNLVLIMFEEDEVIVPKETAWFGFYPDGEFSPVLPVQQTRLYQEDWIGLKQMNEEGRVQFVKVPGGHLGISDSDLKQYVIPHLLPAAAH